MHYPGGRNYCGADGGAASLTSAGGTGAVRVESRKGLTLGSSVPSRNYHQSIAARKVLPRRAPVNLTEGFKRFSLGKQLQVYMVEVATAAGLGLDWVLWTWLV